MPAAVIIIRNSIETANKARTLPHQISNIQPTLFHQGDFTGSSGWDGDGDFIIQ
ncbi:hypothetical protein FORC065_1910 [Yersinia enterocolitica]|nr:hypothetical protein FORC065_1910 [Yersinia enterocolitica]